MTADGSELDHREILHSLSVEVRELLNHEFMPLVNWFSFHLGDSSEEKEVIRINKFVRDIERDFKIRFLTPDYEVILLLYEYGDQNSSDICSMAKASPETVYNVIRRLISKGIIEYNLELTDKRKKVYHLTSRAKETLNQTHKKLLHFLNLRLDSNQNDFTIISRRRTEGGCRWLGAA